MQKSRGRTCFLDLAMNYKIVGNQNMIRVRKALTAVWKLYQLIFQKPKNAKKNQGSKCFSDLAIK